MATGGTDANAAAALAALVEAADEAIIGTSPGGIIESWNPAAERLFGYTADEIIGRHAAALAPRELRPRFGDLMAQTVRARQTLRLAGVEVVCKDGRRAQIATSAAPVVHDGTVRGIAWLVRDMTTERATERALRESEDRFRRVFDESPIGKALVDATGRLARVNQAFAAMLGYEPARLDGRRCNDITHPEDREHAATALREVFGGGTSAGRLRTRYITSDGSVRSCLATAVGLRGESDDVDIALVTVEDITDQVVADRERARLIRQLEHQAVTDALTGLPNRALLHDRLQRALQRLERHPGSVGVLFLDLDRFKVVNDSLGHAAGDRLLQVVGERLTTSLRPSDTVARFGGDEFVVLVDGVEHEDELLTLAERLLAVVAEPVTIVGWTLTPSASIGVVSTNTPDSAPDALLANADLAMYRAKARGGAVVEVFEHVMRDHAMDRLAREADLRGAIERGEFEVHYQPFVGRRGRITGVEALVRWAHPRRGVLLPTEFIALAEETDLIVPLGAAVLEEACRQVARWRTEGHAELHLSVNLSARQLTPCLPSVVSDALTAAGLPAAALWLEVTETAFVRDAPSAGAILHQLRDLGVGIAVDDFGTGYSSLLYLRHFPVQILKLDRFFVTGLDRNPKDTAIVRSVIELAGALGMRSIAEGVETAAQATMLEELGCDLLQGHHFSVPVDASTMTVLLSRGALPGEQSQSRAGIPAPSRSAPQPSSGRFSLLVVDDSAGDRSLLRHRLGCMPQFRLVAEASSAEDGVAFAAVHQPDVVLLDVAMPGRGGLEVLTDIAAAAPAAKIVLFTGFLSDGIERAGRAAGAHAVLDKSLSDDSLAAALLALVDDPVLRHGEGLCPCAPRVSGAFDRCDACPPRSRPLERDSVG